MIFRLFFVSFLLPPMKSFPPEEQAPGPSSEEERNARRLSIEAVASAATLAISLGDVLDLSAQLARMTPTAKAVDFFIQPEGLLERALRSNRQSSGDALRAVASACDDLARRASPKSALLLAARKSNAKALAPLIEAQAKALAAGALSEKEAREERQTAFWSAATRGEAECLSVLLPYADPMAANDEGDTPLIMAIRSRDAECVEMLAPVSDLRHANNMGQTPLHVAAEHGQVDSVAIVAPLSDFLAQDQMGRTPVAMAAECRHADVVEWLAPKGGCWVPDHAGAVAFDKTMWNKGIADEHARRCCEALGAQATADQLEDAIRRVASRWDPALVGSALPQCHARLEAAQIAREANSSSPAAGGAHQRRAPRSL